MDFNTFFDKIYRNKNVCEFGLWEDHVKDWLAESARDNILYLTYEDMSEDTEREMRKIISFLGLSVSDEHIAKVLQVGTKISVLIL